MPHKFVRNAEKIIEVRSRDRFASTGRSNLCIIHYYFRNYIAMIASGNDHLNKAGIGAAGDGVRQAVL